jgi:hypothetical protein
VPEDRCPGASGAMLPGREADCELLTTNEPEGGRLILTNLKRDLFRERPPISPGLPLALPFIVLSSDDIELPRAAALSGNFPPVFPPPPVGSFPTLDSFLDLWNYSFSNDCETIRIVGRHYFRIVGGDAASAKPCLALIAVSLRPSSIRSALERPVQKVDHPPRRQLIRS